MLNNIKGIADITLSVKDQDFLSKLLQDFGLNKNDDKYSTLDQSTIKLRSSCNNKLDTITWYAVSLDAVCQSLKSSQIVYTDHRPHVRMITCTFNKIEINFILDKRSSLEIIGCATNALNLENRISTTIPQYVKAQPYEISHIVLQVDNMLDAERFYTNLGFVVSDRLLGRGVFLRSCLNDIHHRLFLIQSDKCSLHHIAFSVRDIYELLAGGKYMSSRGWITAKGPGRHKISSSTYWYFDTTADFMIEYSADCDILDANWTANEYVYDSKLIQDEDFIITSK